MYECEHAESPPTRRAVVVIPRDQRGDRRGQLVGEGGAGGGSGKSDLGLERQRRQPLVLLTSAFFERRHVTQCLRGAGDQKAGAEAIARRLRRGPEQPQRLGTDDKGPRRGAQQALGAVSFAPFLDALHQPFALEFAKVVVEALARQAEFAREPGGGVRLGELREQLTPRALQHHRRLSGAADHLDAVGERVHAGSA